MSRNPARISPARYLCVGDGLGLVLKRVEVVFGSADSDTIRIFSINPAYSTYKRALDGVHINGRVTLASGSGSNAKFQYHNARTEREHARLQSVSEG